MRKIFASREMAKLAKQSDDGKVQVYSFFPIDRADCECQKMIKEWKEKLATMSEEKRNAVIQETKYLVCPRDKTGMRRRKITCKNCDEVLGYVWATDNTLKDWCDLHYVNWTDGKEWYGCLTPHISPITEQLCFECCCGQDTRDFRANMTLPTKTAFEIEEENKVGREFGETNSKFTSRIVSQNIVAFS